MSAFSLNYHQMITMEEAKKEYCLTNKDLKKLLYHNECFESGRPTHWYALKHLEAIAIKKHGATRLAKRRAVRKYYLKLKEEKSAKANIFSPGSGSGANSEGKYAESMTGSTTCIRSNDSAATATSSSVTTCSLSDNLTAIRQDLVKALKVRMKRWDRLNSNTVRPGYHVTAHVPGVSLLEYARLLGRPTEGNVPKVLKRGEIYSSTMRFTSVMNSLEPIIGESGTDGIGSHGNLLVMYNSSERRLSVTAFVEHVNTMPYYTE